jgi:predicted RNA-binding Zn ribbon-like protein
MRFVIDDERPTAPGPLRLVQEFLNTRDIEAGTDRLGDPAGLRDWLDEHDVPTAPDLPTPTDAAAARELREALRALVREHVGAPPDPSAAAVVNRAAERAPLRLRVGTDGPSLAPAGADAALGPILAAVYTAMVDGTWPRLKVCRDEACEWAFYDRSRNRSGHWCDMAVCGSRHKVRAYRMRQAPPGHTAA